MLLLFAVFMAACTMFKTAFCKVGLTVLYSILLKYCIMGLSSFNCGYCRRSHQQKLGQECNAQR